MVTNRAGSVYSEPAKLTLIAKPVITSNPSAASAAEGDTVTFRVTATGTSLSFQWYYKTPDASDWTAVINNGQSAVYTFNTKKRHDGYLYRCMVTNSAGSVYSEPAKFTLITMPVITSNPSAVSAAEGNTVTFRVTATGTNLSFQWYYKTPNASDWSAVINNGQSAEYSFNAEKRHDGYLYRCMIANSAGSVYSEPAKFTLIAKPVITESPSQVSVTTGKTATFRVTATGTDLSFQWYYKKPGDTEWTAVSSHGTSDNYSLLATTQYNGYAYCCKVTNGAGDSEWSNSAKLTVYTKSVITESPSQVSVTAGNTATFSVTATETDLTYQWYYKRPGDTEWVSAGSKGTSDFYSFTATTQYNGYAYCCKVTNGAGDSEWSSSAKLAVYAKPVITSLLSPVSVTAGKTATFRVTATGTGLTYQWYYKRPGGTEWVSAGSKGTSDSYSFTATTQYNGYAYCCKVTNGAGDSEWCSSAKLAVYAKPVITESPSQVSVTAGNTSTFRVTAAGTDLTYQWYYKRPGDTEWVSAGSKGTSDSYSFTATTQYNGYAYCCKVTNGAGDSEWSSSAKLAVYAKPVITSSFSPVSVTAGKTATFSVTAAGTGLTYQWYYKRPGGTEWVSAGSKGTSDSYSFTATTQYNGYAYCCKVTNGAGDSEWSSSAKLTVSTNSGTTTNSSSTSTAFTVAKNVPTLSSLYNKVDTQLSGRKTSWYYHYGPGTDYLPDEMAYKVDSEHSNKVYAYFLENGWIFAFVQYSTTTSKFVYLESGAIDSTYGLLNFSSASYFEGTVTKETIPYFSPTDKSKQEGKYKISAGTKVKVFFQENNRAYAEFTHENRKVRLWIPMENISNLVYKQ